MLPALWVPRAIQANDLIGVPPPNLFGVMLIPALRPAAAGNLLEGFVRPLDMLVTLRLIPSGAVQPDLSFISADLNNHIGEFIGLMLQERHQVGHYIPADALPSDEGPGQELVYYCRAIPDRTSNFRPAEREFSQLLLLPLLYWQRDVLMRDEVASAPGA